MSQTDSNSQSLPSQPSSNRGNLSIWLRLGLVLGIVGLAVGGVWRWYSGRESSELQKADEAFQAGDLVGTYAHLRIVADTEPPSAKVIERLVDLAIRQGLLEEAESWIGQLPAIDPTEMKRLRLAVASKGMELGHATLVERMLQEVLRDFPREFIARKTLAHLYLLTLRQDDLRTQIAAIDRQLPDRRPDTNLLLMYCTGTLGQWLERQPRDWLERALRIDPTNNAVRAALGQLLIQAEDREAARKVLSESPGGVDRWRVSLVRIRDLLDTGKTAELAALLDGLEPASHLDARFWVARGCVALEVDDLKTARRLFELAMRLDPFDPESAYRLARLSLGERKDAEANELFQRSSLLNRLNRTAKRAIGSLEGKGIKGELQDTATLAGELGFTRLALLLCTALAGDFPEFAEARARLAELRTKPAALQPLPEQLKVLPTVPDLKQTGTILPPTRSTPANKVDDRNLSQRSLRFWDVAESVGLSFQYRRAPTPPGKPLMMNVIGGGVAVLDYDGDGWPDLFFAQGTPLPVPASPDAGIGRLFRNQRGKKYEEVTSSSTISDFGFGQGCSVADFDNDGFADIFVCHYGAIRLHHNNGDGTFRDVTAVSGLSDSQWSSSAAFGDFDRDGDLDLFVVHYIDAPLPAEKCCLPVSYPRTKNAIWENRGDGTFIERTQGAGILTTNSAVARQDADSPTKLPANAAIPAEAYGLAVVAEDLDNDGWLDIYVANDMTPNFLFRNLGFPAPDGRSPFSFAEIGMRAGVAVNGRGEVEAGMGLACADADGDGMFDLFVTNFQDETNTFYRNEGVDRMTGSPIFSDDTARAGLSDLSPPKMGWGCQFIDTLGSGRLDLFFVNSHLKIDEPQTPSYFLNRGGRFTDLKPTVPYFQEERMGRGVATLDWNRDLRPDLVVTYLRGNVSLLNNDSAVGQRIRIQVVGRKSNRDGESARVIVKSGMRRAVYRVSRGGGYLTSNEKDLVIGLGEEQQGEWEVVWPSGLKQNCGICRAGHSYLVIEGQPPLIGFSR